MNMNDYYVTAGRTRKAGCSVVVTVPVVAIRKLDLHPGELVEIKIRKLAEGWESEATQ